MFDQLFIIILQIFWLCFSYIHDFSYAAIFFLKYLSQKTLLWSIHLNTLINYIDNNKIISFNVNFELIPILIIGFRTYYPVQLLHNYFLTIAYIIPLTACFTKRMKFYEANFIFWLRFVQRIIQTFVLNKKRGYSHCQNTIPDFNLRKVPQRSLYSTW